MAEPTTSLDSGGSTAGGASSVPGSSVTQETLGQYLLLEKLGEGGMGTVYKAIHAKLKKWVAVKILASRREIYPDLVERFHQEMEAIGQLDHPNLVRATDANEDNGRFYLVMEYFEGRDLAKVLAARGSLPVAEACDVICQTARGLQYIAERQLVHRDIKPSNLLLTREGQVKILDMGLALLRRQEEKEELTAPGQVMGTMDYMAPEQTLNSHQVDIRADIYSLGCTFYKLLTGQTPFPPTLYKTSKEKARAHREEIVPQVGAFRPDVPEGVCAVLNKMLAKKPEERYQQPAEVAQALDAFTELSDLAVLLPGEAPFGPSLRSGSTERNTLKTSQGRKVPFSSAAVWWALALLLIGGTTLTFYSFWPRGEDPPPPEKKPVEIKKEPGGPPEARDMEIGKFYALLKKPPEPLQWKKDLPPPAWNEGREEIVAAPVGDSGMLGLADIPPGTSYRFRIALCQSPWSGMVGVFFGYYKEKVEGKTVIKWQSLTLTREAENKFRIIRRRMEQKEKGLPQGEQIASHPLPPPTGVEEFLEIVVRGKDLRKVYWGGLELDQLYGEQVNKTHSPDIYPGWLGVSVANHQAVFRNGQLMILGR